jgi:hypothetical protein
MEYILSTGGLCVGSVLTGEQLNLVLNNQNINIIIIYIIKIKIYCNYYIYFIVVGFLLFLYFIRF